MLLLLMLVSPSLAAASSHQAVPAWMQQQRSTGTDGMLRSGFGNI
jgi:hypothetical protein